MKDKKVSSLFKRPYNKSSSAKKICQSISMIENDDLSKSRNSRKQSMINDTNTKSSTVSLFRVPKDNSNGTIINFGRGKNSISYYDRAILKREAKKLITNSRTYSMTYSNPVSSRPQSKIISRNQGEAIRQPQLKTQRQLSLSRLMNTKLLDVLPPAVKYSNNHMSSRNIHNRMTDNCYSSSTESLAKRFQTMKVSIKNPIKSEPFLTKLLCLNNDTTKNLRLLCRLKLMKWLWKKKSFLVEKMISSYVHYKWFFNKYEQLDKKTFKELMLLIELGKDDEFVDQLYLIFGQNRDKTLNIIECLFFFIFTSSSAYERKLNLLLDIVEDKDKANVISIPCLVNILRFIMGRKDYQSCKKIFKRITKTEYINKKDLFIILAQNAYMKSLLYKYAMTSFNIDNKMNEELHSILSGNMGELLYD